MKKNNKLIYEDLKNKEILKEHFKGIQYASYIDKERIIIKFNFLLNGVYYLSIQPMNDEIIKTKIRFQVLKILKRTAYEKKS